MFRTTLFMAALACAASAHDFWVRPASYVLEAPASLDIQLRVGDHFQGEAYARNPAHVQRFVIAGPDEQRKVPGAPGRDPAGTIEVTSPGLHVIGYRSHGSLVTLPGAKFQAYLADEGLERIARLRSEAGLEKTAGRELFSRCAKALVHVGDTAEGPTDRTLGLRLELVAETNPTELDAEGTFGVTLLFDGKPLQGALVSAHHRGDGTKEISARTDKDGRATFRLDHPGEWMLAAVHMVSAPDEVDADWESLWASLTFATDDTLVATQRHHHHDHDHPHSHDG